MRVSILFFMQFALIIAAIGAFQAQAQLRFDSPEHERAVRSLIPIDDYPIADFNAREPDDSSERALRIARNKRYNNKYLSKSDIPRFVFQEGTSSIQLGGPPSHAPIESAFPVNQSDVIVIGEIKDAAAYLSEDKTDVYSEFITRVEFVFKNTSLLKTISNEVITVDRGGGRVRLTSGKEILRGSQGKPMPKVGRRYVFFLASDAETNSFKIITAYELRDGRVFPLDGNSRFKKEMIISEHVEYDRYNHADENAFLNEMRAAINLAAHSNNEHKIKR